MQAGPAPGEAVGGCPRCGGDLIDGRVSLAAFATLKYVFRIGTTEVGTEIRAQMCQDCGHVELTATDPAAIKRARAAKALGAQTRSSLFRPTTRRSP